MSMTILGSQRLDHDSDCSHCDAGKTISFNWDHAKTATRADDKRDLSIFVEPKPLRFGTLFRCKVCGSPWYLSGDDPQMMSNVPRERIPLINQWNERPVVLSDEQVAILRKIGRTPSDVYGNRREFHETPCAIKTRQGEEIQMAIVSMQRHAPFEYWRNCRLATDIAQISPSPFALPLAVRKATSQADEIRMGFAPTLVDLPGGKSIILNWAQNFFQRDGCDTSAIKVSSKEFDMGALPEIYSGPDSVIYFVADDVKGHSD